MFNFFRTQRQDERTKRSERRALRPDVANTALERREVLNAATMANAAAIQRLASRLGTPHLPVVSNVPRFNLVQPSPVSLGNNFVANVAAPATGFNGGINFSVPFGGRGLTSAAINRNLAAITPTAASSAFAASSGLAFTNGLGFNTPFNQFAGANAATNGLAFSNGAGFTNPAGQSQFFSPSTNGTVFNNGLGATTRGSGALFGTGFGGTNTFLSPGVTGTSMSTFGTSPFGGLTLL